MITLKTLPQATTQEVFDQVAVHLLTQGQKSMDHSCCVYRGPGGLKCAAGCLISDEEYEKFKVDVFSNSMRQVNNKVIKVLNEGHGKKVIQYWKDQGVGTLGYKGFTTEEEGATFIYYGVIRHSFSNYCLEQVLKANAEIIELPKEDSWIDLKGRKMLVSRMGESLVERIVICKLPTGAKQRFIAIGSGNEQAFLNGQPYTVITWPYAEPIPDHKEMTVTEIEKELGYKIKIVN